MLVQDCLCLSGCQYCSIELRLDVSCNDNRTMDVTSNHLEVIPPTYTDGETPGDELTKRGEDFGQPVGKSMTTLSRCIHVLTLAATQIRLTYHQSSFARYGRVKSLNYDASPKRCAATFM